MHLARDRAKETVVGFMEARGLRGRQGLVISEK